MDQEPQRSFLRPEDRASVVENLCGRKYHEAPYALIPFTRNINAQPSEWLNSPELEA